MSKEYLVFKEAGKKGLFSGAPPKGVEPFHYTVRQIALQRLAEAGNRVHILTLVDGVFVDEVLEAVEQPEPETDE